MSFNPRIQHWRGKRVWLVGASSGIGEAIASALHQLGAQVVVSARNAQALEDFTKQHAGAQALQMDVTDAHAVRHATDKLLEGGAPDFVVYCAGHYRAMRADQFDLPDMLRHNNVNYVGALHVLDAILPGLLARGQGHISLMGSVAGYRGLPQSLAYGPTKAALINLAETLYLDLRSKGLGVSLINPGFVDTPLTQQNQFTMPALITPAQAAQHILKGWAEGKFEMHFPKRFTYGMKLLELLPYRLAFALTQKMTQH